jgi:uncharacterized protein
MNASHPPEPGFDVRPRALTGPLAHALSTAPVVVVTGARQTGKSTLVTAPAIADGRTYRTLDDPDVLEQAADDPAGLLASAPALTLDEIQRAPDLLLAIKRAVDTHRTPGRFLLTGSANLLLMHRVAESLAGRATYLTLWPLTHGEQQGIGTTGRWSAFFDTPRDSWPDDALAPGRARDADWQALARRGGYPTPALHATTEADRAAWFEGYRRTYLERDLRQLSAVTDLVDFGRVMRGAALRVGNILDQTELARDVGISRSTVHRYLNLLETSYQFVRTPAYAVNRTKRLIKSPKAYWSDTGLALYLAEEPDPTGAHFENLILADLVAWRDTLTPPPTILYWRTVEGAEVDFVIEWRRKLLAVELKVGNVPTYRDTRALRLFLDEYGSRALGGLVLHTGAETGWLTTGVLAVPWWRVL